MARWLAGGRVWEEVRRGLFETLDEARAAAVAAGGALVKERMSGSYYRTADGRSFRISALGWAPGYVLYESREVPR